MSDSLSGQLLGNYRILRLVKRTGMSAVYLARDVKLQRDVIVKTMLPAESGDESFAARFEQEALATARLAHPNIVHIYDFGREGELSYMVMEYLPGGSLYDVSAGLRREGRAIDQAQAVQIGIAISSALHHAHEAGIIHRDVKPSNVLFAADGRPVLVDLGISKVREGPRLTRTATSIGTPEYMSPEQGRGDPVDARTDIYSLGVVLYELLVGALPFQSDTPWGLVYKHIQQPPPPLPAAVPPALRSVVEKAMAKRPADRFASGLEMAAALRRALEVPSKRLYTPPAPPAAAEPATEDARERTRLLRPQPPSTQPRMPGANARGAPQLSRAVLTWFAVAAVILVIAGSLLGALLARAGLREQPAAVTIEAATQATAALPATATRVAPTAIAQGGGIAVASSSTRAVTVVKRVTRTPKATATVHAKVAEAPVPAATATLEAAPTRTPSPTPTPTRTKPAQLPRSTPTARPVATVVVGPSVPVPILQEPDGSTETGGATFRWQLPGYILKESEGFAVLVWKTGTDQGEKGLTLPSLFNACGEPLRDNSFFVSDLSMWPGYRGDGEYEWTVIVVDTAKQDYYRCKQISEQPEAHRFFYRMREAPALEPTQLPPSAQAAPAR